LTILPQVPQESQGSHPFEGFPDPVGAPPAGSPGRRYRRRATDQVKQVTGRRGGRSGSASRERPESVTRHAGARTARRRAVGCRTRAVAGLPEGRTRSASAEWTTRLQASAQARPRRLAYPGGRPAYPEGRPACLKGRLAAAACLPGGTFAHAGRAARYAGRPARYVGRVVSRRRRAGGRPAPRRRAGGGSGRGPRCRPAGS
jgi:hypothetical protein